MCYNIQVLKQAELPLSPYDKSFAVNTDSTFFCAVCNLRMVLHPFFYAMQKPLNGGNEYKQGVTN